MLLGSDQNFKNDISNFLIQNKNLIDYFYLLGKCMKTINVLYYYLHETTFKFVLSYFKN